MVSQIKYDTVDNYKVEIVSSENNATIIARSKLNPKNKACFNSYFQKNSFGIYEKNKIDSNNVEAVLENIVNLGITKGLYFENNELNKSIEKDKFIDPINKLRHKKTNQEQSFTSTGQKLSAHWPIFKKYRDTGYGSIIRATMTLHQVCASQCSFCSTINRTRKDAISLDEAKDFIIELDEKQSLFNQKEFPRYNDEYLKLTGSNIKLRGLILSGGGQPNLWPHFSKFVEWLSDRKIELGLITNGFPKHVDDEIYKYFRWIRLSITPEDASPFYPEQKFEKQRLPNTILENVNQTFGLSYVYGPWTTDELINRLDFTANRWKVNYVRFLTDCNLPRELQLNAHIDLGERLYKLGLIDNSGKPNSKIFHQLKFHSCQSETESVWEDNQCKLQVYNTFWDTTDHEVNGKSYCFPCDSVTVLEDGINNAERRFNSKKWGTVTNDKVARLFTEPVQSFFNPNENCQACLFINNNKEVNRLISLNNNEVNNISFSSELDHVNFP